MATAKDMESFVKKINDPTVAACHSCERYFITSPEKHSVKCPFCKGTHVTIIQPERES